MNVEMWPVAKVWPYEQNPRNNDAAVDAVANSIREYGFRQAIVVDNDGIIICGHTRLKAALKLGLKEVPVHVAEELSPEQVRALRIADNKLHELSSWNDQVLAVELGELKELDVDLNLLGFNAAELTEIFAPPVTVGLVDEDDVPEPPDAATTQTGDLWVLGSHRLLCGDSSSVSDVDRLLHGASINLVNTDPPYNVKVEP